MYMLKVVEPASLYDRLKVSVFGYEWKEDKAYLEITIRQMSALFTFLENNDTLYKVLGMALAVGNIMNGGTAKGRADGFELAVFTKLNTTKDNNQKSMLSFIMKSLTDIDSELPGRFREEFKCWSTKAVDWDSLNKKYNESNVSYNVAKAALDAVNSSGEDADKFTDSEGRDIKIIRTELDGFESQVKQLKEKHTKLCDFFQVDAKDDKRDSTSDFFQFFKNFCKDIENNLPKEEKSRKGAAAKAGGKANPPSFHAEMMAQLAKKNMQN